MTWKVKTFNFAYPESMTFSLNILDEINKNSLKLVVFVKSAP